ncbi:MAG: peptide chain release factor 1 [Candidatus Hydrogenedentes bacterium]|nr:peptide chain release factor 1 [Candidatus Hydrogenedentota bacterium]MDY0031559.1 peptide chain release factor 1 [FCB group bacterium]NLT62668.1 peptide chain release factor 1 [Candidatus Hydrogenedentota bacterium]HNZ17998.1 peptide chain release factor 1 [Candidatus Hydrogenedentota bacterium]HOH35233.1 peptide chain release factor 1 [Candidatus Hydrogenedentota bacterium]
MREKLRDVLAEYDRLSREMASQEVASDHDRYMKCAKAQKRIQPLVDCFRKYETEENRLEQAEAILYEESDPELRQMAEEEKHQLTDTLEARELELKLLLIPGDPNDEKNTIMEIRAGTGGEEAALFAADLFRMYSRYAEIKAWKVEILNSHTTGMGGFKEISFKVAGDSVYSQLKFEGGVHRVQRVPETEAQGRVHTSAVTVAVLPEAEAVDIDIDENDLQIDVYRSSGPGGQSVNTTDSAVRVTYKPTGLVVTCQDEKSQHKNKAKALMVLRARLLAQRQEEEAAERSANRKSQVGSGDRSERIRTYNFPQNRLTDHRIKLTVHRLETIMEGDLQEVIDALIAADRAARIREE